MAHSPGRPKFAYCSKIDLKLFLGGAAFIALVVLCRVGPVSVDATRQLYIIGS